MRSRGAHPADLAPHQEVRNIGVNSAVAIVIDDVLPPWWPRCVQGRGAAEAILAGDRSDAEPPEALIRIGPRTVVGWALDST